MKVNVLISVLTFLQKKATSLYICFKKPFTVAYLSPCQALIMEFSYEIRKAFSQLIIFAKKLHYRCLSWFLCTSLVVLNYCFVKKTVLHLNNQENITAGPLVSTFTFQTKLIICNSLWLTYERDYSHGIAWACLTKATKKSGISLLKILMFAFM